jgi:hypothetical protein
MSQNDVWKKNRAATVNNIENPSKSWLHGQNIQPCQAVKVTDRPRRIGPKHAGLKDYREI